MTKIEVFENEDTEKLSDMYDIVKYQGPVYNTMGAFENEMAAYLFLCVSRKEKKIVGIKRIDLEEITKKQNCYDFSMMGPPLTFMKTTEYLLNYQPPFIKSENINGIEVLFPTEDLLVNQKIPYKNNTLDNKLDEDN